MKRWLCYLFFIGLVSCSSKKKEEKDTSKYFPVLSPLQSQLKHLDTSMYSFIKIETEDGRSDTTYLRREEVRQYAKEFLNIPDVTQRKWGSDYIESTGYDTLLGRAFKNYTSDNEDQTTVKQQVFIMPTFGGNDEVKTVYIEKLINDDDSSVEKNCIGK